MLYTHYITQFKYVKYEQGGIDFSGKDDIIKC